MDEDAVGPDAGLDTFNLDPRTGLRPDRVIRSIPTAAQSVYPETTSGILAPVSTTAGPRGAQYALLAPAPGKEVDLAPDSPVQLASTIEPTATAVIPRGSIAPPVRLAQAAPSAGQTTLPAAAPLATAGPPSNQPQQPGNYPGQGTGILGSNQPPKVAYDENANPLVQQKKNLQSDLTNAQRSANDASTNFWDRPAADRAREKAAKLQGEIAKIDQQLEQQQTNMRLAGNFGLFQKVNSSTDAAGIIERAVDEWKNKGNYQAYLGLQASGQGARADLFKQNGMDQLGKSVATASGMYNKLDKAGSEADYKRMREEVLAGARGKPNIQQLGLDENNIPSSKAEYEKQRTLLQAPKNKASELVLTYKRELDDMGVPKHIGDEHVRKLTEGDFKFSNGNSIPNVTGMTLPSQGGLRAGRTAIVDPAQYGPGLKYSNWGAEQQEAAAKMVARPEERGAINQHKMATSLRHTVMNDDNYRDAAGITYVSDQLTGALRNVAEESRASGTIGFSKLFDEKLGWLEKTLNAGMTNWSAYKEWLAGGQKGPEVKPDFRWSKATIDGMKRVVQEHYDFTASQVGRLKGTAEYVGQNGGDLQDIGLTTEEQKILKPFVDAANQRARLDIDKRDALVIGNYRYMIPEGTKVDPSTPGFIPAGSYRATLDAINRRTERPVPAAPVVAPAAPAVAPLAPAAPSGGGGGGTPPAPQQRVSFNPDAYETGIKAGESSGGKNLPPKIPGGASGIYQFLDSTWAQNKPEGAPNSAHLASAEQQKQAFQTFTNKNATALQNAGVPVNNLTLAMAHQQGSGGATALLKAPESDKALNYVSREAAAANKDFFWKPDGSFMTVAESKAKFAQFYRAQGDTKVAGSAPYPNPQTDKERVANIKAGYHLTDAQRAANVQQTKRDAAHLAVPIGSTVGAIGGTMAGGPVGGVAGGTLGGALGGAAENYLLGNPETQNPGGYITSAAEGGLKGGIYSIPGTGPLAAGARIVGGAGVSGGAEYLRSGDVPKATNAAIGGALGGVVGEAVGAGLSKAIGSAYHALPMADQTAVQNAARVISEQQPRVMDAAGRTTANAAYVQAEQFIKSKGIDPQVAAHAYNTAIRTPTTRGEAITTRPGEVDRMRAGTQLEDVKNFVGTAGNVQGMVPRNPAPGPTLTPTRNGPLSAVQTPQNPRGTVGHQYVTEATQAESMVQTPASNMGERFGNMATARTQLLEHERTAIQNGDTNRANAMRALADTVRAQQEELIKHILPQGQNSALAQHLKNVDTRYRKAVLAGGKDIVETIAKGGSKGAEAKTAFDALAAKDPAAKNMVDALVRAQNRGKEATKLIGIVLSATGAFHFVPIVGQAAAAGGAIMTVAKANQMVKDWMVQRAAGKMVTFKEMVSKDISGAQGQVQRGAAALGQGVGGAVAGRAAQPAVSP